MGILGIVSLSSAWVSNLPSLAQTNSLALSGLHAWPHSLSSSRTLSPVLKYSFTSSHTFDQLSITDWPVVEISFTNSQTLLDHLPNSPSPAPELSFTSSRNPFYQLSIACSPALERFLTMQLSIVFSNTLMCFPMLSPPLKRSFTTSLDCSFASSRTHFRLLLNSLSPESSSSSCSSSLMSTAMLLMCGEGGASDGLCLNYCRAWDTALWTVLCWFQHYMMLHLHKYHIENSYTLKNLLNTLLNIRIGSLC